MPTQANARRDVPGGEIALPACQLQNFNLAGIQTITSGAVPIVTSMLSRYDPLGWGVAASGTITPDQDILADIIFWAHIPATGSEFTFAALIFVNGAFVNSATHGLLQYAATNNLSAVGCGMTGRIRTSLAAGDVVTLRVFQNTGSNQGLDGAALGVIPATLYT